MSKAEEKAIQHCCTKCVHKLGCGMKIASHGRDCILCGNYIKGYHQAEKDLELKWQDMMTIDDLLDELLLPRRNSDELVLKGYYEQVLKRFKDLKYVK